MQPNLAKQRIVIAGGGFAGLNLIRNIHQDLFEIILIDRNNYVFFPPLLYQVATGFLEPSNISYPFRKMFQGRSDVHFKLGEIRRIDTNRKVVVLASEEVCYDHLVLATGTMTNYFGMENVRRIAMPMKTLNDALELRNQFLARLERAAALGNDSEAMKRLLTVVIAGGGPTGVEVAGMLAEMRSSVIRKDYPEFTNLDSFMSIFLVDGGEHVLSPMSHKSRTETKKALQLLNVELIMNTHVQDYVNGHVVLSNGQTIASDNLIWAAGVVSSVFEGIPEQSYGRGKRLQTNPYHQVVNLQDVYSIGDNSIQSHESTFPHGHPQVAQAALQQGANLARNFNRISKNQNPIAFRYKDKGSMAIIGRNKAVADLPSGLHFKGFFAWFLWVFVHLLSLVRYRNRVLTLYNWIVAYVTKDQALRLIIRPRRKD